MDIPYIELTATDRQILNSYALMLDGLGAYLGEGYELVLHSLESLDHSVIKIINGHYTGRKEGSPITDLALKMLGELERDPARTVSPSCTIPITGEHGRIIGLLCMNFHMESPLSTLLQNFIPPQENISASQPPAENFSDNIDDLILSALTETREAVYSDSAISSANKNKEIVLQLYQRGIFNLDNLCTVIAEQQCAHRAGHELSEVKNADTFQRFHLLVLLINIIL